MGFSTVDGLIIMLAPLFAAILTGLSCRVLSRSVAHTLSIGAVLLSTLLSAKVLIALMQGAPAIHQTLYTWGTTGGLVLSVGLWIDSLTALMMVVVTSVSLMVHVYTVGYMEEDTGYVRFFSYIGLFTFSMLVLVMGDNFLQLFFGWEAVGLVSYLLIGFWFHKESAVVANFKAFLVNRVGDLGFLLGIAGVLWAFGSLQYQDVFAHIPSVVHSAAHFEVGSWSIPVLTAITLLLFIGAMGKSAQIPLHVWLPDSMEGPTPISALIHAATMVTAGIFMVARLSPLFEAAPATLTFILCVGACTSLLMGLLGLVQHDIKRVIAYSTLSQLGYMVSALGVSAYAAGVFHLMTHAFFKALLFLGAGSVIIALHHVQDMRKMGGLWRTLPVTYGCMLVGSLALMGFPGLSGFYSKDHIIEAVAHQEGALAQVAYYALVAGVFVTALYSFRLLFLVFHGTPRSEMHAHETPWVMRLPLILLAIPSIGVGYVTWSGLGEFLGGSVVQPHAWPTTDPWHLAQEGLHHGLFVLTLAGVATAWVLYIYRPQWPAIFVRRYHRILRLLYVNYGFDALYRAVFARGARMLGTFYWKVGDMWLIDGVMVHGTARTALRLAKILRRLQTGYLYHYTALMIAGVVGGLLWVVWRTQLGF